MTDTMTKRDGEVKRLSGAAATLARVRRDVETPFRLRCTTCGKILGEVGDGAAATLHCPHCKRLTLGLVLDGHLVLYDIGRSTWTREEGGTTP